METSLDVGALETTGGKVTWETGPGDIWPGEDFALLTPVLSETRGPHLHSHTDNRGQSRDAVAATEQAESHVIGSFGSTTLMDSQLESAGTGGGQPLSSCFSEQFASHFPNFTLQLLLSSHCLNYLLLHKE